MLQLTFQIFVAWALACAVDRVSPMRVTSTPGRCILAGPALKGDTLCRLASLSAGYPLKREREGERDLRPPPSLDLFCKAPALIEPSKAKRRIETSTKDNRRRAGIKVFEKLMKRREKVRHPSRMAAVLSPRFKNMNGLMGVVHRRERCNRKGMYSVSKEN